MSFFKEQLESWLGEIEVRGGRILDVGGGANQVKGRLKVFEPEEYKILDNKLEKMKQEPDLIGDLNEEFNHPNDREKYNIVFMLELAEYLWNPIQALQNINFFLKTDGLFYSSWPLIYPIHSPHRNDYLRYTRFGIMKLLEKTGFKIEEIIGRVAKEPNKLIEFYRSDGMHIKADSTITGYLVKARKGGGASHEDI